MVSLPHLKNNFTPQGSYKLTEIIVTNNLITFDAISKFIPTFAYETPLQRFSSILVKLQIDRPGFTFSL
jgi:hypothetical protein